MRTRRRRMRRTALIKSNNPHLAGGEKTCSADIIAYPYNLHPSVSQSMCCSHHFMYQVCLSKNDDP